MHLWIRVLERCKTLWVHGGNPWWRWKWSSIFLVYKHRVADEQTSALQKHLHCVCTGHVNCHVLPREQRRLPVVTLRKNVIHCQKASFALAKTCTWWDWSDDINWCTSHGGSTIDFIGQIFDGETRSFGRPGIGLRCGVHHMWLVVDHKDRFFGWLYGSFIIGWRTGLWVRGG